MLLLFRYSDKIDIISQRLFMASIGNNILTKLFETIIEMNLNNA